MGFLKSISSELMMDVSISCTSPLIRAMISPFLSSEKKPSGKDRILRYNLLRMSRTIPVRMGIIVADERK